MSTDMLTFRSLLEDDCDFILQHWVGKSSIFHENDRNQLLSKIRDINTKTYDGRYCEMFGILSDNTLVGTISFYQRESDVAENSVYFGIEIGEENRMKGLATNATLMAFKLAKEMGFEKMYSQVGLYNEASLKLHAKCGFEIIEKTVSKRSGREVYNYVKVL